MEIKKFKGVLEYSLRIEYDTDKDEIVDISESVRRLDEEDVTHHYGDLVLDDYWDDETYDMMQEVYEVGEA